MRVVMTALRVLTIVAVCCIAGSVRAADSASEPHNLLNNGNLARGSGNSCDAWRTDAWILSPTASDFTWIAPEADHPGQVEIDTSRDNDARWVQTLSLTGGWYHISVWARTEDILPYFTGANISVLEDTIISADLRGTQPWQQLDLYLKIPPYGADVDVAMRLGGYANLTRGKAFFHDPRVVRVDAPPAGATHVYDLGAIRKADAPGPIGNPWSLYVTYLMLAIAAVVGWRLFMFEPTSAAAKAEPPISVTPDVMVPKKRRKKKSQRRS
jgi:hypothetical protein